MLIAFDLDTKSHLLQPTSRPLHHSLSGRAATNQPQGITPKLLPIGVNRDATVSAVGTHAQIADAERPRWCAQDGLRRRHSIDKAENFQL